MSTSRTITLDLRIPEEGLTIQGFEVEPIGDDFYRVIEIPSVFEAESLGYMDVVKLEIASDNVYELRVVKKRGGWRRFDSIISVEYLESKQLAQVLSRVDREGGLWVRDFGGCLSILLPPDSTWDPTKAV